MQVISDAGSQFVEQIYSWGRWYLDHLDWLGFVFDQGKFPLILA